MCLHICSLWLVLKTFFERDIEKGSLSSTPYKSIQICTAEYSVFHLQEVQCSFFEAFQSQYVLISFLFYMIHTYLLMAKISPEVNNSL